MSDVDQLFKPPVYASRLAKPKACSECIYQSIKNSEACSGCRFNSDHEKMMKGKR